MDREIQGFIDGVNRKEAKAWKIIYTDYYSSLCHYAMKILNHHGQAEDLVQGVIIKLWESSLYFEDITAFKVYLYRAVNNNCLKEIRDRDREDKRLKNWAFFTDDIESESLSAIVFEEVVQKLRKVIDGMPPKQKEVILLSMKKMNNEEIGKMLDISSNTVKKHKKEAYAIIRKAVKTDLFYILFFC